MAEELFGPLLTEVGPHANPSSELFRGAARGTSQTGEFGGLIEALVWLSDEAEMPDVIPECCRSPSGRPRVLIRPDSKHAMNVAQGFDSPELNLRMAGVLRDMLEAARQRWEGGSAWAVAVLG